MSSNDSGGAGGPGDLTDVAGIGEARADQLREAGIESVDDLRAASEDELADVLGAGVASRILSDLDGDDAEADSGAAGGDEPADADAATDDEAESGESSEAESAASDGAADGADGAGADSEATADDAPGGSTGIGTIEETEATGDSGDSDDDTAIAALVSFLIPGAGHFLIDEADRGIGLLVVWFGWAVVGWGIGLFIIGSILAFIPVLGWILWILILLVVSAVQFGIHVGAAYDAYAGVAAFDTVEEQVRSFRE